MADTEIMALFWDALKDECCSDPGEAKRCVMVSEDAFHKAFETCQQAAGLVVVPREPTEAQIYRGMRAVDFDPEHSGYQKLMQDAYKAMIREADTEIDKALDFMDEVLDDAGFTKDSQ